VSQYGIKSQGLTSKAFARRASFFWQTIQKNPENLSPVTSPATTVAKSWVAPNTEQLTQFFYPVRLIWEGFQRPGCMLDQD